MSLYDYVLMCGGTGTARAPFRRQPARDSAIELQKCKSFIQRRIRLPANKAVVFGLSTANAAFGLGSLAEAAFPPAE